MGGCEGEREKEDRNRLTPWDSTGSHCSSPCAWVPKFNTQRLRRAIQTREFEHSEAKGRSCSPAPGQEPCQRRASNRPSAHETTLDVPRQQSTRNPRPVMRDGIALHFALKKQKPYRGRRFETQVECTHVPGRRSRTAEASDVRFTPKCASISCVHRRPPSLSQRIYPKYSFPSKAGPSQYQGLKTGDSRREG